MHAFDGVLCEDFKFSNHYASPGVSVALVVVCLVCRLVPVAEGGSSFSEGRSSLFYCH